jgi:integrase
MKTTYRIFKRGNGVYYVQNNETGKQNSLKTKNLEEAKKLCGAYNEAASESQINREIGMAYFAGSDPESATRTWQKVFDEVSQKGRVTTQTRRRDSYASSVFDGVRGKLLVNTRAEDFSRVLKKAGVFANDLLKLAHNHALGMNWICQPVLAAKLWVVKKSKKRRGIKLEEHRKIIEAEKNSERRLYYEMCWLTGASQTDVANLTHENIKWADGTLTYQRCKLPSDSKPAVMTIGMELKALILKCPSKGPLFPTIIKTTVHTRSAEFSRRIRLLGLDGISLHSYRYAWAERASALGYPERWACEALGHGSKAVHQAYARNADVEVPSLEGYGKPYARN